MPSALAADGTWNVDAAGNWSTAANWSPAAIPGGIGSTVSLSFNITAGQTVTIDTTSRTVGTLFIGDPTAGAGFSAYTLAASGGASLILDNGGLGAVINHSTTTASDIISAPISLNDNLTVNNSSTAGFFQITGTITSTGTQNITFNNSSTGTMSAAIINNTGTVTNSGSGSGSVTVTGAIGNNVTGLVQNSGTSTLILSGGASTNTGGLLIKNGTAQVTTVSGAGTGVITIGDTSGSNNTTLNGTATIMNAITVASTNSGTATITSNGGAGVFNGAVTLNSHNLTVASTGSTVAFNGGVFGTGNLSITNGASTTQFLNNPVNNVGTITNNGAGAGATTIGATGVGGVSSNVTSITENSATSSLTLNGFLNVNRGGTTLTDTAGTLTIPTNGSIVGVGNLTINNNTATASAIVLTNGGNNGLFSFNNTGTITFNGTGSGAETFGGVPALGTASTILGPNVTGLIQTSTTSTLKLGVSGMTNSNLVVSVGSGSTLDINATTNTIAGLNNVSGSGGTFTNTGASRTVTLGGTSAYTFGGVITATTPANLLLTVAMANGASQTLTGANTYTGLTTINAGTLKLSNGGSLASTDALTFGGGGKFEFGGSATGQSQSLGALTPTAGEDTVQVDAPATSGTNALTFSSLGTITAGTALNIVSPANTTVTLTGATNTNGVVGNAHVFYNGGDFATTTSGVIGAATYTSEGSALAAGLANPTLLTGSFTQGAVTVNAGIKIATPQTLTLSGLLQINNGSNKSGAILVTGGNSVVITGAGGLAGPGTADLVVRTDTAGDNLTISTPITSALTGGITKSGLGTLVLSNASNAYTGATTIDAGTIQIGVSNSIPSASNLVVQNLGTLDLNGNSDTVGTLTGPTGGIVTNKLASSTGTLTATVAAGTTATFSGAIQDGGSGKVVAFAKSGGGSQNLAGINNYTGTTTVNTNGGVLQFNNRTSLYNANTANWTAANIDVKSGGTLAVNVGGTGQFTTSDLDTLRANLSAGSGGFEAGAALGIDTSSGSVTYTSTITDTTGGALGLTKLGTNTLNLAGNNSYTGVTTITGGGILNASVLANGGSNSSIGASSNAAGNLVLANGTLMYGLPTLASLYSGGASLSTDRLFTIGTGGATVSVTSNGGSGTGGTGSVNFTNTGTLGATNTSNTTLTFVGFNNTITFAPQIVNNGANLIGVTLQGVANSDSLPTTVVLSNANNSYTGVTNINDNLGGAAIPLTLSVNKLANGGLNSGIGASSSASANLVFTAGGGASILQYTGTGDSTDRLFTVNNGGTPTLDASGSGALNFTNLGSPTYTNANTTSSFTLTGTSTANNTYAGIYANNGTSNNKLIKNGTGKWILTGANTFTGGTTVNAGILQLNDTNTLQTLTGSLTMAGGTLIVSGTSPLSIVTQAVGTLTLSANTSSTIKLVDAGVATGTSLTTSNTTLAPANGTTLYLDSSNGGTLTLGSTAGAAFTPWAVVTDATGSGFGSIVSSQLVRDTTTTPLATGSNASGTDFTTDGGGTLTLAPGAHATDSLFINGLTPAVGTLDLGANTLSFTSNALGMAGSSAYTIQNGQLGASASTLTATIVGTGALTVTSTISSGAGSLVKAGPGTMVLSGANVYTGGTTISGGVLAAGASSTTAGSGAATTITNGPTGTGLVTVNPNSTLDVAGNTLAVGGLSGSGTISNSSTIADGTLKIVNTATARTFAGILADGPSKKLNVTVTGNAAGETLSGVTNTYTGVTTIDGGKLTAVLNAGGVASGIGASSNAASNLVILNGGSLSINDSVTDRLFTIGNNATILSTSRPNSFTNTGAIAFATPNQANTLTLTSGGQTLFFAPQITDNGSGITSVAIGSGNGTGAPGSGLTIAGTNNSYTGATTSSNGNGAYYTVVKLANGGQNSSIGASSNAASNWTFANGATVFYIGSGDSTDRNYTLSANNITWDSSGTGALVMSGAATYGGAAQTRTINFQGSNTNNNIYGGVLSDNGAFPLFVSKSGTGTWLLTGANTYTGGTNIGNGILQVGNGSTTGNLGSGGVYNNAALAYNRSDTLTESNAITGAGTLTQAGAGKLILTGANTYTGTTTISQGTLIVNGSLGNTAVSVNNGGTLGGSGVIGGPVTVNSGGTLSPGNSPGLLTVNNNLNYLTGSTFKFELAYNNNLSGDRGTQYDAVNVGAPGILTIQTGVTANLVFNQGGSAVDFTNAFWNSNHTWDIFQDANAPSLASGNIFDTINATQDSGLHSAPGTFSFTTSGNDVFLNFTATVPEPSTYAMLLGGIGVLAVLRRFSGKKDRKS